MMEKGGGGRRTEEGGGIGQGSVVALLLLHNCVISAAVRCPLVNILYVLWRAEGWCHVTVFLFLNASH